MTKTNAIGDKDCPRQSNNLLTHSHVRHAQGTAPLTDNSQVKMIAEAAPITAKKDEYTGDCSEDIAKFYEEKGRQASTLTDSARSVLSSSTALTLRSLTPGYGTGCGHVMKV